MKRMVFILSFLYLLSLNNYLLAEEEIFSLPAPATIKEQPMEIHCKHFFKGYPLGTPKTNDLIIRDVYALSNNDTTKFADWVAYRLTMHEVDGDLTVERKWKADPWLDSNETLEPKPDDYKDSHKTLKTDRGHQAPLGSFKGSVHASHTNYLSNITPQKSELNQGPWMQLEEMVRDIVKQGKTVYVMTGPLYEKEMPLLPECDEPHKVPSGYWKIIIVPENNVKFNAAAFIFEQNTLRKDKVIAHLTTINEVEKRSGLNFFWELDDTLEESIENEKNKPWAEVVFN